MQLTIINLHKIVGHPIPDASWYISKAYQGISNVHGSIYQFVMEADNTIPFKIESKTLTVYRDVQIELIEVVWGTFASGDGKHINVTMPITDFRNIDTLTRIISNRFY